MAMNDINEIEQRDGCSAAGYDVMVVGAGAVGSLFTALLSLQLPNLKIALVESSTSSRAFHGEQFDPKVMAVSAASVELLARVGVWADISAQRACAYKNMYVWDAENSGELSFSCEDIAREQLGFIVENSVIVNALHKRLETLSNVALIRPGSIKSIDENLDGLLTGLKIHLNDGQACVAKLLVGADGAQSQLRQQLAFKIRQWSYNQHAIITTVETEKAHQNTAWQCFSNSGPLALLPLDSIDGRHFCSIVWSLDSDIAKQKYALDEPVFCEAVGEAFNYRLGKILKCDKRYLIPLRQLHSVDYHKNGVVLLGDAAHTIHPLAGQGANLGFYDAKVLADEIARAIHWGLDSNHPSISKRYQRKRKIENTGAMLAMEGFKRAFGWRAPLVNAYRGKGMRLINDSAWIKSRLAALASGPMQ